MSTHEFHPTALNSGHDFRESIRYKPNVSPERLNKIQSILSDTLTNHGHENITAENFHEVMEHMHKDPRWKSLHTTGALFEDTLRTHLKIEDTN